MTAPDGRGNGPRPPGTDNRLSTRTCSCDTRIRRVCDRGKYLVAPTSHHPYYLHLYFICLPCPHPLLNPGVATACDSSGTVNAPALESQQTWEIRIDTSSTWCWRRSCRNICRAVPCAAADAWTECRWRPRGRPGCGWRTPGIASRENSRLKRHIINCVAYVKLIRSYFTACDVVHIDMQTHKHIKSIEPGSVSVAPYLKAIIRSWMSPQTR